MIDSFGNAIDVRPTISRMGKGINLCYFQLPLLFPGAINGVGTITNAVASGVSSSVVGTVGAVSDGVDAVAYGVTGGKEYFFLQRFKTRNGPPGIKAVGDGVSGGIKAVGKGKSRLYE